MSKSKDSFEEFKMQVLQDMEEMAEQEEKFYREYADEQNMDMILNEEKELYYVDSYLPY